MTLAPWTPRPGYLNTASFGIPCPAAIDAVNDVTRRWAGGELNFGAWFTQTRGARHAVAQWLAVPDEHVSLGTSTAVMLASVAASLPDGSRVLAPENEHNSNLIPYLNHAHRGVTVELVPLRELPDRIDRKTTLVSCSAVQSLTGEVVDIGSIRRAARGMGALLCVDASQACGWLPLSGESADILVCSVYKWLCSPIGGALLVMRPELANGMRPANPGWPSCVDALAAPYGADFDLPPETRRFDTAPNLVSMIGLQASLEALAAIGVETIHRHDVALANLLRAGLGLEPSDSAIVVLSAPGAAARLASEGIRATEWRGNLRLSFHVHNSEEDVQRAVAAIRSLALPPS